MTRQWRSREARSRPDPLGRAGRGRLAPIDAGLRAVQQVVLRAFAGSLLTDAT